MLLRKNIPLKYILGKIKFELLIVTLYAAGVAILYHVVDLSSFSLPIGVPMVMGTVISLLLAFRSNQAYDRWWEARTVWGAIVNDSRTLARQIKTLSKEAYQGEEFFFFKQRFIKRQIAWCYTLSRTLRTQDPLIGMHKFLVKRDMQHMDNYTHIPNALLELHGHDIQQALENGWINSYQQIEIDKTLTRLCDSMGKCERIKNTVFPATYGLYIHFSLIVFFMLLPFSLIEVFGVYFIIPALVAIAAIFFLIEKMAIHLQDPFENKPTDTPMTAICSTIERDLVQMVNESYAAEAAKAEKQFYLL
ncbi:bestrophin family protein [Aridibaculum aurantiacum]|uniref:bestrophin family protein n=1 Tax=Aridibaculum aurantiacum TaxID=2810307 RepID=UPI001A96EA70|nr:bestrophin family ion channel [Aridibaculum aurantiacum]